MFFLNFYWNLLVKIFIFTILTYTFYHFGGFTFILELTKKIAIFLNLLQGDLPSPVMPSSFRDWRFRGERPFLLEWFSKSLGDFCFTELDDLPQLPSAETALNPSILQYNQAMSDWIDKDTVSRQAFVDALAKNKFNEAFSTSLYIIACITGAVLIIAVTIYSNKP